jgi:hypothetical protein
VSVERWRSGGSIEVDVIGRKTPQFRTNHHESKRRVTLPLGNGVFMRVVLGDCDPVKTG